MHRRLRTGCSAHTCQPHFHGRLGIGHAAQALVMMGSLISFFRADSSSTRSAASV